VHALEFRSAGSDRRARQISARRDVCFPRVDLQRVRRSDGSRTCSETKATLRWRPGDLEKRRRPPYRGSRGYGLEEARQRGIPPWRARQGRGSAQKNASVYRPGEGVPGPGVEAATRKRGVPGSSGPDGGHASILIVGRSWGASTASNPHHRANEAQCPAKCRTRTARGFRQKGSRRSGVRGADARRAARRDSKQIAESSWRGEAHRVRTSLLVHGAGSAATQDDHHARSARHTRSGVTAGRSSEVAGRTLARRASRAIPE